MRICYSSNSPRQTLKLNCLKSKSYMKTPEEKLEIAQTTLPIKAMYLNACVISLYKIHIMVPSLMCFYSWVFCLFFVLPHGRPINKVQFSVPTSVLIIVYKIKLWAKGFFACVGRGYLLWLVTISQVIPTSICKKLGYLLLPTKLGSSSI